MFYGCFSPLSLLTSYTNAESMDAVCRVVLEDQVYPSSMKVWVYCTLFVLTCFLEAPIYWLGLHRELGRSKTLWAIFIVNLATHPVVTWGFSWGFSHSNFLVRDYLLVSELFAIAVEGFILMKFFRVGSLKAFSVSFVANLFSWWVGLYVAATLGL
jgi:hypothetical protein